MKRSHRWEDEGETTSHGDIRPCHLILLASFIIIVVAFVIGSLTERTVIPDPYLGCELVSIEKTGKTRRGGAKVRYTEHETLNTYDCKGVKKLQVIWKRWR